MLKVIGFQVIYSNRNIYDKPTNFESNKKALHFQVNSLFFLFFFATTTKIISYTKVTIIVGLLRKNNYFGIK